MGLVASQLRDAEADHASCGVAHEDNLLLVDVELVFVRQKVFQTVVTVVDRGGVLVLGGEAVVHVRKDAVCLESVFAQNGLVRPAIRHHPTAPVAEEHQLAGLRVFFVRNRAGGIWRENKAPKHTSVQINLCSISYSNRGDISNDSFI